MPKGLCLYKGAFLFLAIVIAGLGLPALAQDPPDGPNFIDENLEQAVRTACGLGPLDEITDTVLESLSALNASSRGIQSLSGLEWCKNLTTLQLYNNEITDITPLTTLSLLQDVYLWDNQITDITPLCGLNNLRFVFLHNNDITNITCLKDNPSWNDGDIVNFSGNYIDQYGLCKVLPEMEKNGVLIYKDDTAICEAIRVPIPDPALELYLRWALDLQDEEIYPYIYDTDLQQLEFFIANDRGIKNLTGLEYCINLKLLNLEGNDISDLTPIANLSLLNTLFLGANEIVDITPLAELYSLTELGLQGNFISDITPMQALGGLVKLYLNENKITNITPLQWLLNLKLLTLDNQKVGGEGEGEGEGEPGLTDISCLSRITGLLSLRISGNDITDLTPLTPLVELTELAVANNGISDISPIQNLVNLYYLDASSNNISSITSLVRLKNIVYLYLNNNQLGDVIVLAGYPDLSVATLAYNKIPDISPLVANTGLGDEYYGQPFPQVHDMIDVRGNTLSVENICNDILNLRLRNVSVKTDEEQVCDDFAESFTLTTEVQETGTGTIEPPPGSRRYVGGTKITVTADPADGYDFVRFDVKEGDDDDELSFRENPLELIMDSNKNITAVFALSSVKYTLDVEVVGGGTVQLEPTAVDNLYSNEARVEVTATANKGWAFDHWEGALAGTLAQQPVIMNANKMIRAVFIEQGPPQTLRIYVEGNGTTDPVPGSHPYPRDQVVQIHAYPALGYVFARWEGDLPSTSADFEIKMTTNKSITAVFEPDEFDYTLAVGSGGGGTVEVDPLSEDCESCEPGFYRYHAGDVVTITAVPDEEGDFIFDYWTGAVTSSLNPVTITMDSDKSVTPVFLYAPIRYNLTIGAMEGGTTSPPPGTYSYAEVKVTVTAEPAQGYEFDHWEGDYSGSTPSLLVTMSRNIKIDAFFKPFPFVTAISPNFGFTVGGITATITGGRLLTATEVWFDDRPAFIVSKEDNAIEVITPAHDRGVASVVVVTDQGETTPLLFTYDEPPGPPQFGEVVPAYGSVSGGDTVLIRGQNLKYASVVLFDGKPGQIKSSTESRLTVVTPDHAEGPVDLDIITNTGSARGAGAFTYLPPPQVAGISPGQGLAAGGETVTILGVSLGQTSQVVFDAAQAVITARTPNQVTVTTPAHVPGTVDVLVITPGGIAVAQNNYTYYSAGGTIRCRVTNDSNRQPINDATVSLNTGESVSGSTDGAYLFSNLPSGGYEISIVTADCGEQTRSVTAIANQQVTVDVALDCGKSEPATTCQSPAKRLTATISESTIPLSIQDSPTKSVRPDAVLAVRLTAPAPVDPASAWAYVEAEDWTSSGGSWRPIDAEDGRDGWIVYEPAEPLPAGQAVAITVGASTLDGTPIAPVTYDFNVAAAGGPAEAPTLVEAPEITPLPTLLAAPQSGVYRIAPSKVFSTPTTILIPIPENSKEDADIYYYSESAKHSGWYPARNVSGFVEPGTRKTVEVDGQRYIQVQVNHGGVIQLGQTIRLNLGGTASIELGYTRNPAAWLLLAGTVAALSLALGMVAARKQKD